jgi:ribosomal protein L37AE/L43A
MGQLYMQRFENGVLSAGVTSIKRGVWLCRHSRRVATGAAWEKGVRLRADRSG